MKKILSILTFLVLTVSVKAQDSTLITITPQARDLEYIGSFIFANNEVENLYDSIKIKFRVQNPPTGNTTVSVTAYTIEWLNIIRHLNNDATAIKANCTDRIETLLRAVNQPYLTGKLDAMDTADTNTFQAMRQFGRSKLRKANN